MLAYGKKGLGTLMLSAEQQAMFVAEAPEYFSAVAVGWGKGGATLVRMDAPESALRGALAAAFHDVVGKQAVKKGATRRARRRRRMGDDYNREDAYEFV